MNVDIASICYNEEILLPMWIESWLSVPFINKIYLVDGGSTDKSFKIADRWGDRVDVICVPWRNDFARQRNIAIKRAKSEWIMQPDIDEIPCGKLNAHIETLNDKEVNEICLPYVKFHDWRRLWFFNDDRTPRLSENGIVYFGDKSTITIFRKNHLVGYSKSLHEMPVFSSERKQFFLKKTLAFVELHKLDFFVGHYDQAKHFEQAKKNGTSVHYEMGLKRARYRLISPVSHQGKVFDEGWAKKALENNDKDMLEELGKFQYEEFLNQHKICDHDVFEWNNDIVKEKVQSV